MRITRLENVCMLSVWDEMVLDDNVSYQLLFNGFRWFSKCLFNGFKKDDNVSYQLLFNGFLMVV